MCYQLAATEEGVWSLVVVCRSAGSRGDVDDCGLMLPLCCNVIFLIIRQAGVSICREVCFIRLIFFPRGSLAH